MINRQSFQSNNCFRYIFIIFVLLFFLQKSLAQVPPTKPKYEPDNPFNYKHMELDRWLYIPSGLHGSVGSIDMRYSRNDVPLFSSVYSWSGSAWQGERINIQLVLWSANAIRQIRCEATDLQNKQGDVIDSSCIKANFVRYVLSDREYIGCTRFNPLSPATQAQLTPDIIDNINRMDIESNSTRPIWVTIDIPRNKNAGKYVGKIIVKSEGNAPLNFQIDLDVLPLTLPEPSEWAIHLDLWQNPWAVARYHDVEPWSPEHILILEPLLKMLSNAGQKCVTTSIIHHAWNAETYDGYESMVEWIKNQDGSWDFDYTIFNKYVELCDKYGINKQINCFSMIGYRNNAFRYLDKASGEYRFVYADPGTKEYEEHWFPFLEDFVKHLKNRGWFNKTCIAMDERPLDLMNYMIAVLDKHAPGMKISLAAEDAHEGLNKRIHDYCVSLSRFSKPDILKERNRLGLITTYYPCCSEEKPNTFLFSPPAEATWMGWHAAARNYSGFLRWSYCNWTEDPLKDTRFITWNAGDCFLVYPGPRSSIRFERLREGFQDYEKIKILKNELQKMNGKQSKNLLGALDNLFHEFSYENALKNPCAETVNKGKKFLNEISKFVANSK